MSNSHDEENEGTNGKRIPIQLSKHKTINKKTEKKPSKSNLESEDKLYPVTAEEFRGEEFKISPWLIIGLFISALGVGALLDPNKTVLDTPSFQSWSLIIIGLLITIPGIISMAKDYFHKKNKSKLSQEK